MQPYPGRDRRQRDRARGFVLRRRQIKPMEPALERRRNIPDGFDIAGALEIHLDQCTTRRSMLALLDSWLGEAKVANAAERDHAYIIAVERAIAVMKASPDVTTAIAVLQRRSED